MTFTIQWPNREICPPWPCPTLLLLKIIIVISLKRLAMAPNVWNICRFWHLSSNGVIAKFGLCDVDLNFQYKKIKNVDISETVRASANNVWIMCTFWHLQCIGVVASIMLLDRDILFEVQHLNVLISLKRWELEQQKNAHNDFYRCVYFPSVTIAGCTHNGRDLLFQGQNYKILISGKQWEAES